MERDLNSEQYKHCHKYRVSMKSFPDFTNLLYKNYARYKHRFFYKVYLSSKSLLCYISTL
jgi:hypothetical protein